MNQKYSFGTEQYDEDTFINVSFKTTYSHYYVRYTYPYNIHCLNIPINM